MEDTGRKDNGKARAYDHISTDGNDDRSFTGRVIESAKGLAGSFANPSQRETAEGLSDATAGKVQSSAQAPAGLGDASQSHRSSSTQGAGQSSVVAEAFREKQTDDSTTRKFKSFLEHTQPLEAPDSSVKTHQPSAWASEYASNPTIGASQISYQPASIPARHTYDPNAYNDGADVLALLSDPNFVAIADVYDTSDPTEDAATSIFSQNFSPQEQEAVTKMKASLPPAPIHNPISPTNPLNLIPSTTQEDLQGAEQHQRQPGASELNQLTDWSAELNSYTDEVWGDLLPTVNELKQQLDKAANAGNGQQLNASALERLQMVLGHVRERGMRPSSHTTSNPSVWPAVENRDALQENR